ncbi:MAG TPA: hypothetical protein VFF73_25275 [Planctomycetota bacterium]|nr:hypothetical protein [Planctomycetota bacterium]
MPLSKPVAVTATLVSLFFLASPALAQPVPPAASGSIPLTGLGPENSRSPIGFVPPTPDNLQDYLNAVGAVQVTASFESSKKTVLADKQIGPFDIPLATVQQGAKVNLQASYSKKNGDQEATLDGITVTASGVGAGPIKLQKVAINADGSLDIKLNNWIPEIDYTGISKQKNGDMRLKGPWWAPSVVITKVGDVKVGKQVNLFGHYVGPMKTVGHIDPKLVADWPPKFSDIAALVSSTQSAKVLSGNGLKPLPPKIDELAGTLSWDVKAKASGLPVTVEGAPVKADTTVEVKGAATLANGQVATIGSSNTAHIQVDFAKQTYGDAKNGLTLEKGSATIDGAYKLSVPLDDTKKMVVAFDGSAAYSADADNVHLSLPNGASLSVGELSLQRNGTFHVGLDNQTPTIQLDDATYTLQAKGPITIEKLGPISRLDMNGTLTSTGMAHVGASGLMTITGNVEGEMGLATTSGLLPRLDNQAGYYKAGIKSGSVVDVHLDQVSGALQLPLDGQAMAFKGASATGDVGVHADLTGVEVKKGPALVTVPDAHVDAAVRGTVNIDPGFGITGSGAATGDVRLPQGGNATVTLPGGINATAPIDKTTEVDVNASISKPTATGATSVRGVLTGELGVDNPSGSARGVSATLNGGVTASVEAPFAVKIGADGKPVIDPSRTSATMPVRISVKKGSKITFNGKTATVTSDEGYIQLTGEIALDATGKPVLKELKNVQVNLELGNLSLPIGANTITIPGVANEQFKGDVTFSNGTIQIKGSDQVTLAGQKAPLINITF